MRTFRRPDLLGLSITIDDLGLAELAQKLDTLSRELRSKIVAPAVRHAGERLVAAARANIQPRFDTSGTLKNALAVRVKIYDTGRVVGVVGPRRRQNVHAFRDFTGRVQPNIPTKYAHLFERGARAHIQYIRGKKGNHGPHLQPNLALRKLWPKYADWAANIIRHPGAQPKPFLQPAVDTLKDDMANILKTEIAAGIRQALTQ
jgi:HK97 gp10 family phage protein